MPDLSPHLISVFGDALIHASWQAAIVSILFVLCCIFLRGRPHSRHAAGLVANILILSCLIGTLIWQWKRYAPHADGYSPASKQVGVAQRLEPLPDGLAVDQHNRLYYPRKPAGALSETIALVETYFPSAANVQTLTKIWLCGFVTLSLMHVFGLIGIGSMMRRCQPIEKADEDRWRKLANALDISRPITFRLSVDVLVPMTVRWLKPAVLVPLNLGNHFSVAQIDSMIAHEIAHIRRMDYVVNQIQLVVEAIFWFHPGVWIISWRMRTDREICCDTLAVRATGESKKNYALMLRQAINTPSPRHWRLAMSVVKGSLVDRFAALADPSGRSRQRGGSAAISILLNSISAGLIAWSLYLSQPAIRASYEATHIPDAAKVASTLSLKRSEAQDIRLQLSEALQAAKNRASLDDPRYARLIEAAQDGVDGNMVWKAYLASVPPGRYPTVRSEYSAEWPYADAGSHRQLVRQIWAIAKARNDRQERAKAVRAALIIGSMKREVSTLPALMTVVLDRQFESISTFPQETVRDLRHYISASKDVLGDAVTAVRKLASLLRSDETAEVEDVLKTAMMCRSRSPEISFVVVRLTEEATDGPVKAAVIQWLQAHAMDDEVVQSYLGTTSPKRPAIMSLVVGSEKP